MDSWAWGLKDPRLALLGPLWFEVLEGRDVIWVASYRSADRTIDFLRRQQGLPPGKAADLWEFWGSAQIASTEEYLGIFDRTT